MNAKYVAISAEISPFLKLNQWSFNAQANSSIDQFSGVGQIEELAVTGVSEPISLETGSWRLTLQADSAVAVILALTLLLQAMSKFAKIENS
jgi:hypothetical protein